ncbi:MAG: HIT domain-containing protein [bacterium]
MSTYDENCLFCKIVKGIEPSKKVLETEDFLVIHNKYPVAPIHLLVLDKNHNEKKQTLSGEIAGYWDKMINTAYLAINKLNLDKTGYKLENNGAGYNHFEHEHLHILGGIKK